jgi:tetratricopeptide (TPR) repeat protein
MSDHGGVNQVLGQAYFLDLLGDAYNGLGRYDEAIVALSEAAASFAEHGAQCAHAVCLFKIAQSHLAIGRTSQGIACLEECLPIFRELQLPDHEAQALRVLDGCRAGLECSPASA